MSSILALLFVAVPPRYEQLHQLTSTPPYSNVDTVVVADFTNSTDVPELGRPGPFYDEEETDVQLLDAMRSALKLRPTVKVLSPDRVDETLKQMNRKPDEPLTPELAREVCVRAPCKAVLARSVTRDGSRYRVDVRTTDCRTGDTLVAFEGYANNPPGQ